MNGRGSANPERDAELAMLFASGLTLTEIAALAGLTRERVRQVVRRAGVDVRPRGLADPLAILRACEGASSVGEAARCAGCCHRTVTRVLTELGMLSEMRAQWAATRREHYRRIVETAVAELGRTPTVAELAVRGATQGSLERYFGSIAAAMAAAGTTPRTAGKRAVLRPPGDAHQRGEGA